MVVPAERMPGQGKLRQRVVVSDQPDGRRVADPAHGLDTGTRLADAEALPRKDLAVP